MYDPIVLLLVLYTTAQISSIFIVVGGTPASTHQVYQIYTTSYIQFPLATSFANDGQGID